MIRRAKAAALVGAALLTGLGSALAWRYPLDGYEYTGIRRLRAYALILEGRMPGGINLQPGARLSRSAIQLRLTGAGSDIDVPRDAPVDSALQAGLERIVGRRHPSYRAAILDVTDPSRPRYAGIGADQGYIPGSVGKLLVMAALFRGLREAYPDDVQARESVLRDTRITADSWVVPNSHEVPVVAPDWSGVTHRAIRVGDTFTLWEWVDHMVSPSSNAAGSIVWREAMLLEVFGDGYPPSDEERARFFRDTPKPELTRLAERVIEEPLLEVGIDPTLLRIRTMFTRGAENVVPGLSSYATPRALVRWLTKLEQGRLVDRWSSLEMKRLLYYTRRRYRYAISPALNDAAVYFKSGSLFRCVPEEGYACGQYRGNAENLMHSVAIVESPADAEHPRVYLVSVMSNVLKVNSAEEHMQIGTQIERLVASLHPDRP